MHAKKKRCGKFAATLFFYVAVFFLCSPGTAEAKKYTASGSGYTQANNAQITQVGGGADITTRGSFNNQEVGAIRYRSTNFTEVDLLDGHNAYTYEIFNESGELIGVAYAATVPSFNGVVIAGDSYAATSNGSGGYELSPSVYNLYDTQNMAADTNKDGLVSRDEAAASEKSLWDKIAGLGDDIANSFIEAIGRIFEVIGYAILVFANALLYLAGQILNASMKFFVTEMGGTMYADLWAAVKLAWATIRNFGNTIFIFVLLYAAFNTVLGRKDGLDLVPRIIVVALLVNFSFLFASSVIDVSNELAKKFYDEMTGGASEIGDFSGKLGKAAGLEILVAKSFSLKNAQTGFEQAGTSTASSLAGFEIFIKAVLSAAFTFVLCGFFVAVAFTLVARFVTLIVLCITAALAFLAYLLPRFEGQSRDWWAALIGQSFYAPAVFLMLLITLKLATAFQKINIQPSSTSVGDQFSAIASFGIGQFFNFCILIGLLYASMTLAKKLSEQGSKAAISIGQRAQKAAAAAAFGTGGFALRGSLGRLGQAASDSDWLKKQSVKAGVWGALNRRVMGVAGKAQESSFDFRKTGVSAAMAAATGADYGKVSDKAGKGWKGVADAKQEKQAQRIEAVKKMDISAGDKKEAVEKIAESKEANYKTWKKNSETYTHQQGELEKKIKGLQEKVDKNPADVKAQADLTSAQGRLSTMKTAASANEARIKKVEDDSWKEYNKETFGLESSSKAVNYSTQFAHSMRADANSKLRNWTKVGVGALGTVGVGALALASPPAAIAVGAMGAGRLISGLVRGTRDKKKTYTNEHGKQIAQGFRAAGRNEAMHAASSEYLKKEDKYVENKQKLDELNEREKSLSARGERLSDADKTKRNDLQRKIEKHENAGKKKED